jgi:hypothetical protein
MLRVSLATVAILLGATTCVRADDVPEQLKLLSGKWTRAAVKADDGKTEVTPQLTVAAEGKTRLLLIGAGIDVGNLGLLKERSSTSYDLGFKEGGKKTTLTLEVEKNQVEIEYKLDMDTLKLTCKQKVPAGKHLKAFDISGEWKRVK